MDSLTQSSFTGWALVELLGRQQEIGYVTTEYFGGPAMFRIEIPELAERRVKNETNTRQFYDALGRYLQPGEEMICDVVPARTRFVSPASLYAMNPCTEEAALKSLAGVYPRPFHLVGENVVAALPAASDGPDDLVDDEDDEPPY